MAHKLLHFPKFRALRSHLYIPYEKNIPQDAHLRSHQLMIQSGLIQQASTTLQIIHRIMIYDR